MPNKNIRNHPKLFTQLCRMALCLFSLQTTRAPRCSEMVMIIKQIFNYGARFNSLYKYMYIYMKAYIRWDENEMKYLYIYTHVHCTKSHSQQACHLSPAALLFSQHMCMGCNFPHFHLLYQLFFITFIALSICRIRFHLHEFTTLLVHKPADGWWGGN